MRLSIVICYDCKRPVFDNEPPAMTLVLGSSVIADLCPECSMKMLAAYQLKREAVQEVVKRAVESIKGPV